MKWVLISDSDLKMARDMLEAAIERVEDECARSMCSCDTLSDGDHAQTYRDALHGLEVGMHITDAVPVDYQKETA